jgi:hypothetical protein
VLELAGAETIGAVEAAGEAGQDPGAGDSALLRTVPVAKRRGVGGGAAGAGEGCKKSDGEAAHETLGSGARRGGLSGRA